MIFCLIYSLNIPHSYQNPSFFTRFLSTLAAFQRMVSKPHENNFDISFRVIFTIATEDGIVSGFDDKHQVHGLFIVSRLSS